MTKNKSLEELLLEKFNIYYSEYDGQYHNGRQADGTVPFQEAKEEILQSLLSLIPEKKPDTDANDLRAGTFKRGQDKYRIGYNQAIRDFEKSVREWVKGNGTI